MPSLASAIRLLVQRPRPFTGSVVANWNSGVATSGNAGADLFTYGAANQWWRLIDAYLLIFPGVWNIGATITIRAYETIMGAEREVMNDDWLADGTDGQLAYVFWWFTGYEMFGPVRIEVFSDQAADDGVSAPYEFRVKDW
jgi:hypothetical protein